MPINPEIALDYKPPEIENPLQAYGRALSIQHLAQQGPLLAERLQAEKLENQKRREDMADSDALKRAYMEANGDQGNFKGLAIKYGASPKAIQSIDEHYALAQDRYLKLDEAGRKRAKEQVDAIGAAAQAVQQTPDDQLESAFTSQRGDLIKRGYATSADVPDYSTFASPAAVRQWLQLHANASIDANKQIDNATQAASAKALADERKATQEERDRKAPGEQADAEGKVRKNNATKLAAAADTGDKEEYSQAYYAMSKDERAAFPHPDKYDADSTPGTVRNLGMTPSEQSSAAHRDVLETIAQQNLDLRRDREAREKGQTANSQAAERTKAHSEYDVASRNEATLHAMRRSLGNAIASKTLYVNKYGRTVPMATVTTDPEVAKDLVEEMRGRLDSSTEELKNTVTNKYDAGTRLGHKPKVSLDEALSAISAGNAQQGEKPPQGPPTALAGPASEAPAAPAPVKAAPTASAAPRKINKQTGQIIIVKDGKWVDEKTGQPVQ